MTDAIPEPDSAGRLTKALPVLLLLAVVACAYFPALGSGFLAWDDTETVLENPYVKGENESGFSGLLTDRIFLTWLPLYFLSLRIDHLFSGLSPSGYHLTNLLLHFLNSLVVMALARRLTGRRDIAWGAAFLFALHPAAVESVAWISERKGLLAFLFGGLSMLVFLKAVGRKTLGARIGWHAGGALLLFLALTAKGSALAVPLFLLLAVALPPPGERRPRWLDTAPYLAVGVAMALLHYSIARQEGPALAGSDASVGALVLTDVGVLGRYLRTLVFPLFGQSLVPDIRPDYGIGGVSELFALVAVAALLVLSFKEDRRIFFGLAIAILALAPFNNLLPRTTVLYAERYLYFSVFGAALALALLLGRIGRRALVPIAAGVVVFLVLTFARTRLWADGLRVFEDAEQKAEKSWLASMKHGEALSMAARDGRRELWPEAEAAFGRAARNAKSVSETVHARLAEKDVIREEEGREEDVLRIVTEVLERVAELPPAEADVATHVAEMGRGLALFSLGRIEEAGEAYRAASRAAPTDPAPLAELAVCRARLEDLDGALEAAVAAHSLDRSHEAAAMALAEISILAGDSMTSRKVLAAHLEERPDSIRALCLSGELSLAAARPAEATERFKAVLALEPDHSRAERGLAGAAMLSARAAFSQGDTETAAALARRASELSPDDPAPLLFLAGIAEDRDTAIALLKRAMDLPGGGAARETLAAVRIRTALERVAAGEEMAAVRSAAAALTLEPRLLRIGSRIEVRGSLPRLAKVAADEDAAGRGDLLLGLSAFLGGEYDTAEARLTGSYREATAAGGGDPAYLALLLRGRTRLERGDRSGALDDFSVLARFEPDDPWPVLYRAETLSRSAIDEQTRAIAAGEEPDVDLLFDAARSAALRAVEMAPDLLEASLRLGEVEFASGRYVDALRVFTRIKREHPGRPEPMLDLAGLYRAHFILTMEKTYLVGAEEELRSALEIEPGNARARAALGEVLLLGGKSRSAAVELMRAVAADPGLIEARETLANLYAREGRSRLDRGGEEAIQQASELAQRALALGTRKAGPHVLLAEVARLDKDYEKALVHLGHARAREPDSAEVKDAAAAFHKSLGYAYLLSARKDGMDAERLREKAFAEFRKAIEAGSEKEDLTQVRVLLGLEKPAMDAEPMDPRVAAILEKRAAEAGRWFDECGRLWAEGDLEGAERAILESLDALVTGEGYFRLARLKKAMKDEAAAEEAYRAAIRAKPSLADAWLNLGTLLYMKSDLQGAITAYEGWLLRAGDPDPETRAKVEAMVQEMRTRLTEKK